jgi:hypothetical protein
MHRTLTELPLKEIQEKYADRAALVSAQAPRKRVIGRAVAHPLVPLANALFASCLPQNFLAMWAPR